MDTKLRDFYDSFVGMPEKILGDVKKEMDANNIGIIVFPLENLAVDMAYADYDVPGDRNGAVESSKILAVININDGLVYLMDMDPSADFLISELGDFNVYPKDMTDDFFKKVEENNSDYWADQTYTPYDTALQVCLSVSEVIDYLEGPVTEPVKLKK